MLWALLERLPSSSDHLEFVEHNKNSTREKQSESDNKSWTC